jgi:hypothetical protein
VYLYLVETQVNEVEW